MQFDLSDEQKLLTDTLGKLLAHADAKQGPVARFNEGRYADTTVWPQVRELGLCNLLAPADRGGLGDELLTLTVAAEALAYGGASVVAIQQAVASWLLSASDIEQPLIDALHDGSRLTCLALCEDLDRWRPEEWHVTAGARLNGAKCWVIGAEEADVFVVGVAGGQFALVDRDATGLSIEPGSSLDRTRPFARIAFADTPARILKTDSELSQRLFDQLLVLGAADALGAARRALTLATSYATTRKQFGRPIGAFQAIKHQLADMAVETEPCRALVWYAAHAWDRRFADAPRAAALAKAHVTDVAVRVARAATEAHGGMGFTWEYPLHIWLKRALFDGAWLGGIGTQRNRAAALAGW